MKKRFLLLAAMLLTLIGVGKINSLNAQTEPITRDETTITIGTTSTTDVSANYPFCSSYKYTHTQQIYTPELLKGNLDQFPTGNISKIKYYLDPNQQGLFDRFAGVKVYMRNSPTSSFSSNTSWDNEFSANDLVFSGSVDVINGEIEFDLGNNAFTYNPEKNLIIHVEVDQNNITTAAKFKTTTVEGYNSGLYYRNKNNDAGISNSSWTSANGNPNTFVNVITLTFSSNAGGSDVSTAPEAATDLSPDDSNDGNNPQTLSWTFGSNTTEYMVLVGTEKETSGENEVVKNTLGHEGFIEVGDITNYTVSGLSPNTTYYWQVISKNDSGETASEIASFTTPGGNIIGILKNGNEYFISDATISIKKGDNTIGESSTDDNGNFEFNNIAIGEYQLNIVKDGLETYITNITVEKGDNNITIYMPSIISIDNSWTISGGISNGSNELIVKANAVLNSTSTVGTLTIEAGKSVTISDGGILIVNGKINNNGKLIIEDGGQIFQNNDDVQATFYMNIVNPTAWSNSNTTGWQFISSPFTNTLITDFTYISDNDDYDLYKYDATKKGAEWVNRKDHVSAANTFGTHFLSGHAYLASYKYKDQAVLNGKLTTNNVLVGKLNYNKEYTFGCFNLLGNPFPYDIEWSDFSAKDIVDGYVVIGEDGTYDPRNSGVIKAGDGFFVKTIGEGDDRAIFNKRKEPVSSQSKNRNNTRSINIIASNNEGEDNVIINLMGKKEGFPKMQNINRNVANIYVKDNDIDYCIYNCDENTTEVELSFVASQMGTYSISLDINGDFENVVLVDRLTGIETNMLIEDEYKFVATSNDNAKRFFIRLDNGQQSTDNDSMFVYQSGEELIVNAEGTIQIIDMMGRVVYSSNADNNRIDVSGLNKSAYIVRNINENTVRTQKIVIL